MFFFFNYYTSVDFIYFIFCVLFFILFYFLLYNTVLVLPYIDMISFLFTYLAVPGLSCNMWDLIPRQRIKPWPPASRAQSLNHRTYRSVFTNFFSLPWSVCIQSDILHLYPSMYVHTTIMVIILNPKSDQILGSLSSIVTVT